MGAGCSNATAVPTDLMPTSKKGRHSEDTPSAASRQLNKQASKLGGKRVVNSFIVAKSSTMRKRESHNGNITMDKDLGVKAMEELKVIQEDKSFRTPRGKSLDVNRDAIHKLPCGVIQLPEAHSSEALVLPTPIPSEELESNKERLSSSQDEVALQGAKFFRERLMVPNAPSSQLCRAGVVPLLTLLAQRTTHFELQHEALWTLANLCAGTHEDCQHVVDQGLVPALIQVLGQAGADEEVLLKAIWTLGNIVADSRDYQVAVVDQGALQPLLHVMRQSMRHAAVMRQAAWLLCNMLRPEPCSDVLLEAVPALELLLASVEDADCLTQMCWALSYISETEDGVDHIAKRNALLRTLAYLMNQGSTQIITPALRVLGNACSSPAACTNVVNAGGVSALVGHLRRTQLPFVKKECIWALSNIAISGSDNIKRLIDEDVFALGIQVLHEARDNSSLLRECAYLLANPWALEAKVSEEVALRLLGHSVVQELVGLLQPSTPEQTLIVAIDGLQEAVKRGQRIMMWQAKQGGSAAGQLPSNPVIEVLRQADVTQRLNSVSNHEHEDVSMKVNGLINVLQFM